MAVHYRSQGVILGKEDRRDSDQLLTVYTKDFGKVEILAKAVKKITSKLRGGADLFYLSEIEFIQGKNRKTLTDAILIDKFTNIRKNLKKLQAVWRIAEVLDKLSSREEKEGKVWELLIEVFRKLDDKDLKLEPAVLYYYFLWNLLAFLGYKPELYSCGCCRKKLGGLRLYFDFNEGGVICGQCPTSGRAEEISQSAVKIIRLFLNRHWQVLARLKIDPESKRLLKRVSEKYLSEVLSEN
jgi:DNA repair protein RecO (recombination protein O)